MSLPSPVDNLGSRSGVAMRPALLAIL